jgi:hypothetical protein
MPVIKHRYLFFLFVLAGLFSCRKSYLDLNPADQLSKGSFWKTSSDAELGLTGCYNALQNSYLNMDNYPAWDALSDNAWGYNNYIGTSGAMTAPMTSESGGIVTGFYGNAYSNIAVENYFLANVGSVAASPDDIREWKAEALFLRSYFYFYLTQFYGDVPMILTPFAVGDTIINKSPKAVIEAQIESDLDTAISNLPSQSYTTGHAVKASAQFLEAKIFLYNQQYTQAAALCNQIMQSGNFHLYPNYYKMFITQGQGPDNTEIIFSVEYLSPNNENNSSVRWGWWMDNLPLQNLVDEYEMTDGLPISQSPLYNPASPYSNRDPRLTASICVPGSFYGFVNEGQPNWSERIQYIPVPLQYDMRKYVDSSFVSVDAAQHCENANILMRYADVLLSYAEAQNEAVGPDQSVYDAVNQVRARSNMPSLPAGLSQTDMLTRIQHERRVEMAFEGERWLDLKRWNLAATKLNAVGTSQVPTPYTFKSNEYLWPFPQSEIDYYHAHNAELGQNPGY